MGFCLYSLVGVRVVSQVLGVLGPAPASVATTTVAVVFLVMRVGYHFVAFMVLVLGEEFLQEQESRGNESSLGDEDTLDSSESDDAQEQGNEGLDLQLEQSEDGEELLQLLLLATACNEMRECVNEIEVKDCINVFVNAKFFELLERQLFLSQRLKSK